MVEAGKEAETGKIALIRYTIYAKNDGELELVETTEEEVAKRYNAQEKLVKGPRPVVVGKSKLIDAVEEMLLKMKEGDEAEFEVPPEKAYGPHDPSKVIRVPVKHLRRSGIPPRVGEEVSVSGRRGRIVRVTERFAYIDFNHPLAGKKLKIWLKFEKELREPSEKAIALARRWLGIDNIEAEYNDGELILKLPPETLSIRDLDSKAALLIQDLVDTLSDLKKVTLKITIELSSASGSEQAPEESEKSLEESASTKTQGSSAEDEAAKE